MLSQKSLLKPMHAKKPDATIPDGSQCVIAAVE